MNVRFKSIFGVCLALLLAVTSQSMAVSRGMSTAAGQMVICTGSGPITVYVDADGTPTTAAHSCADCIVALTDAVPVQSFELSRQKLAESQKAARVHQALEQNAALGFCARAPPYSA